MTKNNGKPMAEDENDDRGDDAREELDSESESSEEGGGRGRAVATGAATPGAPGFFHIYKTGQGYWTRMGTAAGAGLILLATCVWLYQNLPVWSDYLRGHRSMLVGLLVGVIAGAAMLVHWLMNKPGNADFLIATDSEMKKVNWTTKADLIGSTKVVIFFVITVTALLFVVDVFFGYVFWFFGVLKTRPF